MARRKNINYKPGKPQATMGVVVGVLFTVLGVTMVLPMTMRAGFPPIALFGLVWTGIAVYNTVINAKYLFGEKKGENENLFGGYEVTESHDGTGSGAEEHDHIQSMAPGPQKRLEQLKNLLDAGLVTKEEYEQKRKEILKDI